MGAFQRTDSENFKDDMERVFELFPRLHERRTQKAGTMSGGEQQMCAIGRALMARPKLLLLDEPSMGLAPIFVEKIFEIVREINEQGTPVLLVEQNALMALDTANRGYVMETGQITLEGPGRRAEGQRARAEGIPRPGLRWLRGGNPPSGFRRQHPEGVRFAAAVRDCAIRGRAAPARCHRPRPAASHLTSERWVGRRQQHAQPAAFTGDAGGHLERSLRAVAGDEPEALRGHGVAAAADDHPARVRERRVARGPVGEGEQRVRGASRAIGVDARRGRRGATVSAWARCSGPGSRSAS